MAADEPTATRMSQVDYIRFRTRFIEDAITVLQDSEYIEMFFGRLEPPDDESFAPIMIRGRVMNDTRTTVLMTRAIFVSPAVAEK
jgi:hypothetical protein